MAVAGNKTRRPPEADWGPAYSAFLAQAQWHLGEHQRRSTNFVTSAVAILGFDGVVLALLVSSNVLAASSTVILWVARGGAVLVTASALSALGAMWPRSVNSADRRVTGREWRALFDPARTKDHPVKVFAEMLLFEHSAASPEVQEDGDGSAARPGLRARVTSLISQFWAWPIEGDAPLEAASNEATVRGKWFTVAVLALALGVGALCAVVWMSAGVAGSAGGGAAVRGAQATSTAAPSRP